MIVSQAGNDIQPPLTVFNSIMVQPKSLVTQCHHCHQYLKSMYITIQNITSDTAASMSHTSNISYQMTPSPLPPLKPCNPTYSNTPEESTDTYPPIKSVFELIEADRPGKGFAELEGVLEEEGLVSSSHLVMLLEDVLCVVGDMGKVQARVLHNYAKCSVLLLLGLTGNYDEPEIPSPDKGIECIIGVREDLWQLEDEDEDHSKHEGSNEDMRSV